MTKTLLITGGASGIGAAVARAAAEQGFRVAVNYRSRERDAAGIVNAIVRDGGEAVAVSADVGDETAVIDMFDTVERQLGVPDAVVNSAGIAGAKKAFKDVTEETFRALLDSNVLGTMLVCREALRRMQGGVIVNVSSMAAPTGGRPGSAAYAASKGAVDSLTLALAKEAAASGFRVNAVRPGMTVSDMTPELTDEGVLAAISATIPMGRPATVEEAAAPILWLLSDAASFVNGALLDVSGGGFKVGPETGA